ncbi:MAG TPA: tetratricopeptide repeat protein [Caulobacteraceae bacterium]|jgi:tetratricopeptide (TPR) repeat protein|nr:tetratricopeptide repeat protein [Caulobacteraceae bacterium]
MQNRQATLEQTTLEQATLEQALARHQAGDAAAADALYSAILDATPRQANALHLSGLLFFEQGRYAEAAERWERLAAAAANEPQAWFLLADARRALGDQPGEVRAYRNALDLDGGNLAAWIALGAAESVRGEHTAAIAAYEQALTLDPAQVDAHAGLAAALCGAGRAAEAVTAAERAVARDPAHATAWFVLAGALKAEARLDEALAALERSVALQPGFAPAQLNLASLYGALNREADAERALRVALALDPALKPAISNLAFLLIGADRVVEAQVLCEAALERDPAHDEARWALTLSLLRQGDYARGWPLYAQCEWEGPAKARFAEQLDAPMWRGEPVEGRTLLVCASEGLGDTLQFSRFLKPLADLGAKPMLACDGKLVALLQQLPGAVIDRDEPVPPYDLWVEQMSLPWLLRTTLETLPAPEKLVADPARVEAWRAHLPAGRKFGIVWSGNPAHPNDARRSMRTEEIAPLLTVPGWTPVSLQVGARSGEIATLFGLPDHAPALADFEATAALIENLDLVIAVDTAVAHLAGAMGKPVWVMLSATAEWRWLAGRSDTPWYPTMRTVRQSRLGDWSDVVSEVAQDLAVWQGASKAA